VVTGLSRLGKTVIVVVRVVVLAIHAAIQQLASSPLPTMLSVILAMKTAVRLIVNSRERVLFVEQARELVIHRRLAVALMLPAHPTSMLQMDLLVVTQAAYNVLLVNAPPVISSAKP